jgi:hypothetical protein
MPRVVREPSTESRVSQLGVPAIGWEVDVQLGGVEVRGHVNGHAWRTGSKPSCRERAVGTGLIIKVSIQLMLTDGRVLGLSRQRSATTLVRRPTLRVFSYERVRRTERPGGQFRVERSLQRRMMRPRIGI